MAEKKKKSEIPEKIKNVPLPKLKKQRKNVLDLRAKNREELEKVIKEKDIPISPKTLEKMLKEEQEALEKRIKKKEKRKKEKTEKKKKRRKLKK